MAIDSFTRMRLLKFTREHREKSGQLPTLQDYDKAGFSKKTIETAVKAELIEQFYVTLTNGSILKGFKVKSD